MPKKQENSNDQFDNLKEWICKQLNIKPDSRKKKPKIPKRTHFTIWYVIIVFFCPLTHSTDIFSRRHSGYFLWNVQKVPD